MNRTARTILVYLAVIFLVALRTVNIPLTAFARVEYATGLGAIRRIDGKRVVSVRSPLPISSCRNFPMTFFNTFTSIIYLILNSEF